MLANIEGRVAIVTGGGQGLGEAICRRLAAEGCKVLVADLNGGNAATVAADLPEAMSYTVDVTDEAQVAGMVAAAVARWGRLDIMVANAGILIAEAIEDADAAKWRTVIDVNLVGAMLCCKYAAREFITQQSGALVAINSKSGKRGSFRNSAYAASKFGAIGLIQSVALELAPHGARANAICPGNLLDSPLWQDSLFEQYARNRGMSVADVRKMYEGQVPLGRGASYDDITNMVVFLASDASSYMTGQAINVTGGQVMSP
ncbi:MAG TPA: sorbitol-6-phosphate dehydrogenase [Armatimonadota bacterium]|nr:sorbitol-6-phosphate dehydrogenase [Armatimonadota bacterium]HOS43004.1 sorbitol-6-phosphate dehydrogenase [Armatimonadota bacterium]